MMNERGLSVDHFTIFRWVQRYAPDFDERCRPHLRSTNDSWRVDETYVKVRGKWMHLYRAVDSTGQTLDFLLNETRCTRAAKRFFRKMLGRPNIIPARVIHVDKNPALPTIIPPRFFAAQPFYQQLAGVTRRFVCDDQESLSHCMSETAVLTSVM